MLHVIADDRERSSGVVDALRRTEEVAVAVQRLSLGDYRLAGRLLVERKTLVDLTVSIADGRLFQQAARLANAPEAAALILEGTARDLADSDMRREAIQGALLSVTLFMGVPLLRAKDPEETARLMHYAARQQQRLTTGVLPRQRAGKRPTGKRAAQLYLLQGLPGVGPTRAERLLAAFGSVGAVMQAAAEELTAVDGIGSGTAEKIRWAVSERAEPYAVGREPVLQQGGVKKTPDRNA